MALRYWAEGYASAEDIDLGTRATFGFRYPFEGPMLHYDLTGVWRWPKDVREKTAYAVIAKEPTLSEKGKQKIIDQYLSGKPWFLDPSQYDEAIEARDRDYARRLKELYWGRT